MIVLPAPRGIGAQSLRRPAVADQGESSMKRYAWCLALFLPGATAVADPPEFFDWPQ
jgi:hypothetical protein